MPCWTKRAHVHVQHMIAATCATCSESVRQHKCNHEACVKLKGCSTACWWTSKFRLPVLLMLSGKEPGGVAKVMLSGHSQVNSMSMSPDAASSCSFKLSMSACHDKVTLVAEGVSVSWGHQSRQAFNRAGICIGARATWVIRTACKCDTRQMMQLQHSHLGVVCTCSAGACRWHIALICRLVKCAV